jgi:hypothetical protein
LTHTYILGKRQNIKVCPECRDLRNGDHEQYWVGIIGAQKVSNDPQALREPRPDIQRINSVPKFAFNPIATLPAVIQLNNVFITEFDSVLPGVVIVPAIMGPIDF